MKNISNIPGYYDSKYSNDYETGDSDDWRASESRVQRMNNQKRIVHSAELRKKTGAVTFNAGPQYGMGLHSSSHAQYECN
jgi:hypothetical protein